MKTKFFFLILIAVLGMSACKERVEPKTYYVNQEMLRYCWFPVGSYWIYEAENSSGLTDSVYITNTYQSILPDDGEGFQSERYGNGIVIQGKRFGQTRTAWPSSQDGTVTIMVEGYSDSTGSESDHVFFWDENGSERLSYYPELQISNRWDSIVIQGITYYNAIEIATDLWAADWTYNIVWAKDVGVIRRTLVDGTSWELVSYHIN